MLTLFLKSGLLLPVESHLHPHPIPSLPEIPQTQRSFAFLASGCHFPSPPRPKQLGPFSDFISFIGAGVLPRCDSQRKYKIVIRIVISHPSPGEKQRFITWTVSV